MQIPYRLETPRLVLRCLAPADAAPRKEAVDASLAHLARMSFAKKSEPLEAHLAHARKCRGSFDLDQDHLFVVLDASETRLLGEVCLLSRAGLGARELGYWVRADEARKGITTEAGWALVKVAFELFEVDRVDVRIDVDNAASAGTARKIGFVYEGTLRQRRLRPGEDPRDDLVFSIVRAEYGQGPAARLPVRALDFAGGEIAWPAG